MQSVRIHAFGGPEVLVLDTLPVPNPQPDEILIRVHAAGINPIDYKIRNGGYFPEDRLPITLGRDVSGVVERCGDDVDAFKPGDAVYAMLAYDRGGYAELVATRATDCAIKPQRLDHAHAAAVPLAALTAWQGIFDHGGLRAGHRILVHGATGGVGHFAVQFARTRGATVFATCSGRDVDFARSLGAEQAIDYKTQRFEDIVRDIDVVFDLIGGETQERSWTVLNEGGRIVSTVQQPSKEKAAERNASGTRYMTKPNGVQLAEIARLIDDRSVRVEVDKVFPLQEAANAERTLEQEHVRGKVVLKVA
ncbi:NADP-dependent oxidoreductase [Chelativorans salis]|uniref:NADP-dependent oxidoreductase n=1 Tax=Chelativorans salis TaxID=2978478 RepID=A0ABT2LKI3_9HYPH|nr:NADP-dependent oxidoreductase [Chelativorans sp. EGI FJ00035]MCT7373699.1 NADP-dependent oxidoreductase [Chelativorans sp. EGI FJ00035]